MDMSTFPRDESYDQFLSDREKICLDIDNTSLEELEDHFKLSNELQSRKAMTALPFLQISSGPLCTNFPVLQLARFVITFLRGNSSQGEPFDERSELRNAPGTMKGLRQYILKHFPNHPTTFRHMPHPLYPPKIANMNHTRRFNKIERLMIDVYHESLIFHCLRPRLIQRRRARKTFRRDRAWGFWLPVCTRGGLKILVHE